MVVEDRASYSVHSLTPFLIRLAGDTPIIFLNLSYTTPDMSGLAHFD